MRGQVFDPSPLRGRRICGTFATVNKARRRGKDDPYRRGHRSVAGADQGKAGTGRQEGQVQRCVCIHSAGRPLLAACTVAAALFTVPAAQAASVPPVLGLDNPSCKEYGATSIYKFEGSELANGTHAGMTLSNVHIGAGSLTGPPRSRSTS